MAVRDLIGKKETAYQCKLRNAQELRHYRQSLVGVLAQSSEMVAEKKIEAHGNCVVKFMGPVGVRQESNPETQVSSERVPM